MRRIKRLFKELREKEKVALIPYVMAGYPDLEISRQVIEILAEEGADLIEIGLPYSDPLADGVTIQQAAEVALSQGITTPKVFNLIEKISPKVQIPLILMTYYNAIYGYGLKHFAEEAVRVGAAGVIIPDLPPEEALSWRNIADSVGLETIFLVAPTSTEERIRKIARFSTSFIYCVSLTGVTGARKKLPADLRHFIAKVRLLTTKPLAVGFGISTPEQVKEVAKFSDGVIIGSALINKITEGLRETNSLKKVRLFLKEMRLALNS